MWYTTRYENTHFYPTFQRRRTAPDPGGIAFVRCLCDAPLPDLASIGARGTTPGDRPPAGLRRPNRAQRDPRVQRLWTRCPTGRVFASPSTAHGLHGRRSRTAQRRGSHRSPHDFGQERSTWTLELAARVSFEQGIISHEVSDESVRRALKRLKTNWKRAKHWITSPDPQYLRKKTRATG
jgi:hypothetical protein